MLAKSVPNVLNAAKQIALLTAVLSGLALTVWAQATGVPAQTASASAQAAVAQPGYKVEETRLGQWNSLLPFNPIPYSLSSDGRHVAYINDFSQSHINLAVDDGLDVISDGAVRDSTAVSSDGKHVAYIRQTGSHRAVVTGRVGAGYKEGFQVGGAGSLIYSPDGNHLAYAALGADGSKSWAVVVDGKPIAPDGQSESPHGGAADRISSLIFSPDSKRTAYIYSKASFRGKRDKEVVLDGRADPECDEIENLQFSADSQHVAYEAKRDKSWSVVVDGHPGAEYEEIAGLRISSDGRRVAYAAKESGTDHWLEFVDDWEYGEGGAHALKAVDVGNAGDKLDHYMRESQDRNSGGCLGGSPVNFTGPNDACAHVNLGSTASFSPDGKRVAFVSVADQGSASKSPFSVVVDGEAGPRFSEVGLPLFSPDGKHVAYVAGTQLEKSAVNKTILAPVGFAWVTRRGETTLAAVDFLFRSKWSMAWDGQLGPNYEYILDGSQTFDPDGVLEFLAIKWETKDPGYPKCRGFCFGLLGLYRVKYFPADWHPPAIEPAVQPMNLPAAAPAAPRAQVPAATVFLSIDSTPTGADIEIDNAFVGNTPSTIPVPAGSHQIAVKKKGFLDWTKTLKVTGGTIRVTAELEKASQ